MNEEIKEYTYKEEKFTFKKRNLLFRAIALKFKNSFIKEAKLYTEESEINMKKYEVDKNSAEYKYWFSEYQKGLSLAMEMYCYDASKLKEIFELCLDGNLSSINYECETDEDISTLQTFGALVLGDFFSFITGLLMK